VSNAGHRVWQLTVRVLRCSECGRAMSTNHILSRSAAYYRCAGHYQGWLARCPANRTIRAEKAEAEVWEFVRGILTDPECLAAGLEKVQENEARVGGTSVEEEEASWLKRLSEIERKEERLLDLRLEGDISGAVPRQERRSPRNQRSHHGRSGGRANLPVTPGGLRARQGSAARIPCPPRPRRPCPRAEARALPDDALKGRGPRRGAYSCRSGL
jgi:Recombinase zinc beta ribbon domain